MLIQALSDTPDTRASVEMRPVLYNRTVDFESVDLKGRRDQSEPVIIVCIPTYGHRILWKNCVVRICTWLLRSLPDIPVKLEMRFRSDMYLYVDFRQIDILQLLSLVVYWLGYVRSKETWWMNESLINYCLLSLVLKWSWSMRNVTVTYKHLGRLWHI